MQWVVNENTAELKKHNKDGDFTLTISQDGSTAAIEDNSSAYLAASAFTAATWAALMM